MGQNLGPLNIKDTYQSLVQISGSVLTNGTGSVISSLSVNASTATSASYATTASYAANATTPTLQQVTTQGSSSTDTLILEPTGTYTISGSQVAIQKSGITTKIEATGGNLALYGSPGDSSEAISVNASTNQVVIQGATILLNGNTTGSFTGSLSGNATTATSASYATTASFSNTTTNVNVDFANPSAIARVIGAWGTAANTPLDIIGKDTIYFNTADSTLYAPNFVGTASLATTASHALGLKDGLNINASSISASSANFTSASIGYLTTVTGSVVKIGDAFVLLNTSDVSRYAGLKIEDSGSATPVNYTASWFYDSQLDDWNYSYSSSGGLDYAVALFGPHYSTQGSPTYLTNNRIPKSDGDHHLNDSIISDDGSTVSVAGAVSASAGFTGSLHGNADTATSASYAPFTTPTLQQVTTAGNTTTDYISAAGFNGGYLTATSGDLSLGTLSGNVTITAAGSNKDITLDPTRKTILSGSVVGEVNALTIASTTASLDCSLANFFTLGLANAADTHLTATNVQAGQTINLKLTNNATAAGTISFNTSVFKFEGGTPFTATATTNAVDVMTFISFDGSTLQATGLKNFS